MKTSKKKIWIAALIILCQGKLFGNLEYTLVAVMITLAFALALRIFFLNICCTDMTMALRQMKARNRIWQNLNAD